MNGSGATTPFTLALGLSPTLPLTPPLTRRRYDHGAQLFREGETAGSMFIIKSGRVEVSCRGADGRTNLIGQRGCEESCGETSCLLHKPRATTVTRTTNPDP